MGNWLSKLVQVTTISVAAVAVFQELEKSDEERTWHGQVGPVPYDFRRPTLRRLKQRLWNPEEPHIFTPHFWGVGWTINFFALLEKLRLVGEEHLSEDDFLKPTPTLKKIIEDNPAVEEA